jgi:hypothetical protein
LRRKSKKYEIDFLYRTYASASNPDVVAFHAHLMYYTHVHNNHNVYNMPKSQHFSDCEKNILFLCLEYLNHATRAELKISRGKIKGFFREIFSRKNFAFVDYIIESFGVMFL